MKLAYAGWAKWARLCAAVGLVWLCLAFEFALAAPDLVVRDQDGQTLAPGSIISADTVLSIYVNSEDRYVVLHALTNARDAELIFRDDTEITPVRGERTVDFNLIEDAGLYLRQPAYRITIGLSDRLPYTDDARAEPILYQDFWVRNPMSASTIRMTVGDEDAGFRNVSFNLPDSIVNSGYPESMGDPLKILRMERIEELDSTGTRWVGTDDYIEDIYVTVGENSHNFVPPSKPGLYRIRLLVDGFILGETVFEVPADPWPTLQEQAPSRKIIRQKAVFDDRDRAMSFEHGMVASFRVGDPSPADDWGPAFSLNGLGIVAIPERTYDGCIADVTDLTAYRPYEYRSNGEDVIVVNTGSWRPGRYQFALVGEYVVNPFFDQDQKVEPGQRPILDIATVEIEGDAKPSSFLAVESTTASNSAGTEYAAYAVQLRADVPDIWANDLKYRLIRHARRMPNGLIEAKTVYDPEPLEKGQTIIQGLGGWSIQVLGSRVCEDGTCVFELLDEFAFPRIAENEIPFPAGVASVPFSETVNPWRSEPVAPAVLCGVQPELPDTVVAEAYVPPAELDVYVQRAPDPAGNSGRSIVGVKVISAGETPAADVELAVRLFNPLEGADDVQILSRSKVCEIKASDIPYCNLGDLESKAEKTVYFDTNIPVNKPIAWRTGVRSTGDLGDQRLNEGLLDAADLRIHALLPISSQLGRTENVIHKPYPFAVDGSESPSAGVADDQRYLFVVGEGLPDTREKADFGPQGDTLYHFAAHSSIQDGFYQPLVERGWGRFYGMGDHKKAAEKAKTDGLEAILVDTRLQKPALPGVRQFFLNGQKEAWTLRYGDLAYRISFARHVRRNEYEPIKSAFVPERVRLRVDLSHALDIGSIPVQFEVFDPVDDAVKLVELNLKKTEELGPRTYISKPIDFYKVGEAPSQDGGEAVRVRISRDNPELLLATINPQFERAMFSITHGQRVGELALRQNPSYGKYTFNWTDALKRAASCKPDMKAVNWSLLTNKEAETVWNIILFTDAPLIRELSVKFGHHAAALLMRDKFLEMMEKRRRELEWSKTNKHALMAMVAQFEPLSSLGANPFFDIEVTDFDGSDTKIRYALTSSKDHLMKVWKASEGEIDAWRLKAMQQGIDKLIEAMDESLEHARDIDKCDAEELVALTGYGFEALEQDVKTSLMRLTTSVTKDGKPHQLWEPDLLGRRWIDQLAPFQESVDDQQKLADLDTTVFSLVFAAITMPLGILEGISTTAYFVLVGVEATELVASTAAELVKLKASRDELEFAEGSREILGDKRYNRARAQAQSLGPGLATLGLSAFSLGMDVSSVVRIRRVARGAKLAEKLGELGGFAALNKSQQRDLVEYIMDARALREVKGPDKLSVLQRRMLARVDGTFRPDALVDLGPAPTRAFSEIDFSSSGLERRVDADNLFSDTPNGFESRVRDGKISLEGPGGETVEVQVGKRLGYGSTSEVFEHPTLEGAVIRVTYAREGAAARRLDEFGEDVLTNQISSEHIRAANVIEEIAVPEGSGITRIAVVERLDEVANVTLARRADELVDAARAGAGAPGIRQIRLRGAEAVAYSEAMADLNRRGYVWLDNKTDNFAFVPKDDGSGRVELVVLDAGGIVPVRAEVASFRGMTIEELAREIQYRVNGNFDIAVPSRAGEVRPEARALYRRKAILNEYGDVLDWREIGLTRQEELWFNPWAGEELADIERLFEVPPSLASRSARAASDIDDLDSFVPPPAGAAEVLAERPTNPFDQILANPSGTLPPRVLDAAGVDAPLGRFSSGAGTAPTPPPNPNAVPMQMGVNAVEVQLPNGRIITVRFEEGALGQGSFNTAFKVNDEWVIRAPGGRRRRPTPEEIQIDDGGRAVFIEAFGQQASDWDNVRLIYLREQVVVPRDQLLATRRSDMSPVDLEAGDVLQVVEYRRPFSAELTDPETVLERPEAYRSYMTPEEAMAYDRAHRELNQRGLVWLDNKWDNFAFEDHPRPSFPGEKRLVILDTGGIVAVQGRNPEIASRLQRWNNGGGPAEFRSLYEDLPLSAAGYDLRYPSKRELIVEEFGEQVNMRSIGLDTDDMDELPFLPTAVEEFPKARALSGLSAQEAAQIYATYRNYLLRQQGLPIPGE